MIYIINFKNFRSNYLGKFYYGLICLDNDFILENFMFTFKADIVFVTISFFVTSYLIFICI